MNRFHYIWHEKRANISSIHALSTPDLKTEGPLWARANPPFPVSAPRTMGTTRCIQVSLKMRFGNVRYVIQRFCLKVLTRKTILRNKNYWFQEITYKLRL